MLENYVAVSNKVKHTPTLDPAIPFTGIYPRKMKTCSHTHTKSYKNVHRSLYFIMAINRRMDKQTMVYSFNEIIFSNKKGLTDIHNNMGESQKHYVK